LSKNLGASTSWSPKGLPRPVMGLLYLFTVRTSRHCEELARYLYASDGFEVSCFAEKISLVIQEFVKFTERIFSETVISKCLSMVTLCK
jgi:hypothetical protein